MARKNYKKFVASAATATLVASAIVPVASADVSTAAFTDVPKSYEDAINFVVSNNLSIGLSDSQYGINSTITRGDFAIILAKAAGLMDNDAASAGFSDVPKRGALAVNSLKAADVVNGVTATSFGFGDPIKRGDAAIMLQKALELESGDTEVNFTDVKDRYQDAVAALVNLGVTNGVSETQFGTDNNIKRGDFAKWIYALENYIEVDATIQSVDELADIKIVQGEKANLPSKVGVTYENGNEGTAAVEWDTSNLDTDKVGEYILSGDVEGTDLKASVKVIVQADELGEVEDLEITTTVIDDDQKGQYLEFLVNGKTISVEDLTNVYSFDVEFEADKAVFVGDTGLTSTTGEIDPAKVEINDEFEVKVVLTRDGNVSQSAFVNVLVANLNATPQIGSVVLLHEDGFRMISDTLVVGETASVDGLLSKTGDVIKVSGEPTFSSDNTKVATVDLDGNITAHAPGKATITVQAGTVKHQVTLTVTNTDRELANVTPSADQFKFAPTAQGTVKLTITDQYGDPYAIAEDELFADSTDGLGTVAINEVTSTLAITVDSNATAGDYKVYVRDGVDAKDAKLLSTIAINVSKANTADVTKTKLESPSGATSVSIDGELELHVNEYTEDGGFLHQGTGYTVESADERVATVDNTDGIVTVTGVKAGSTDIVVKDENGTVRDTFKVTVADNSIKVNSVKWLDADTVIAKGVTVGIEDVLEIVEVADDNIVKGITLNIETTSFVRIDGDNLYLDRDDDGEYDDSEDSKDVLLGTIAQSIVDGSEKLEVGTETESGSKGEFLFTFTTDHDNKVLTSQTVKVDVK